MFRMSGGQGLDFVGARVAGQEPDGDLVAVAARQSPDAAAGVPVLELLAGATADHVGLQIQDVGDLGQSADGHLDPSPPLRGRTAVAEPQALTRHAGAGGDLVGGEPQAGAVLTQQRGGLVGVLALADVVQPAGCGVALVGAGAVDLAGLRTVGGGESPVRQLFAGDGQGVEHNGFGH